MKINNWVPEENISPFIELVAGACRYQFEEDEFDIIVRGISDTHTEEGKWFEYRFAGKRDIFFRIGHDDPGTGVIMFEAECPKKLGYRIEAYIDVCQTYTVTKERREA